MLRAATRTIIVPAAGGGGLLLLSQPGLAVAFAVGWVLSMVPMSGRRPWTLLAPAAIATALLGSLAPPSLLGVLAAVVTLRLVTTPGRPRPSVINGLSAAAGVALVWAFSGAAVGMSSQIGELGWSEAAVLATIGIGWFAVDTSLWVIQQPGVRLTYRYETVRFLRDWPMAVALMGAALTVAVLWNHSPTWAVVTGGVPLLVTTLLSERTRKHARLVDLTVSALGRLPEAAGVAQQRHSSDVANLAEAMARADGMAGRDVEELRRAALLHDAGLVEATKPEVENGSFTYGDVARWGAELIGHSHELAAEAAIVGRLGDPYRRPGSDPDPEADRRSHLIRIACRVTSLLEVEQLDDVLEHLYEQANYALDPTAVALVRPALSIMDRTQGALQP